MPAKKQSRTRSNKNKLNKTSKVPNWVIGLVLLIVVGTGAFLVYNSFAIKTYSGSDIYCDRGYCKYSPGGGNQGSRKCVTATGAKTKYNYYCKYY